MRCNRLTYLLVLVLVVSACGDDKPRTTPILTDGAVELARDGALPVGNEGIVKIDKPLLDFGAIDVGLTTAPQTVTVTVSVAPVVLNPTVVGDDFAISATTCRDPQPVGTCTISVVFSPTQQELHSGELVIGNLTIALSASGPGGGASFSATDRIDLATVLVGTSTPVVVEVVPARAIPSPSCRSLADDLTIASQTCPAAGELSAPCTFTFSFHATTPGPKGDLVVCNVGGQSTSTTVVATVVTPPSLRISPAEPSFTTFAHESEVLTLHVGNDGGSATGNLTASVDAPDFRIVSNGCVRPLPPLGACSLELAFAPTWPGTRTATLTITDTTLGLPLATASLTGTALAPAALTVWPVANDFGALAIGQSKTAVFTMTNTGDSSTGVNALFNSDAEFLVGTDLCSGRILPPLGKCTLDVTFTPSAAGTRQFVLTVIQTSSQEVLAGILLSGSGYLAPASLVVTPTTLDFRVTSVGVSVGPTVLTVTNAGGATTGPLSVVQTDSAPYIGKASQYAFTTTCSAALAPGERCIVSATLLATETSKCRDPISALLTISDGGGASATATLVGVVLELSEPHLDCGPSSNSSSLVLGGAVDDASLVFEDTVTGHASPAIVCRFETPLPDPAAECPLPADIGEIRAEVTGDFSISDSTCPQSLPAGSTCSISIAFNPQSKGRREGYLAVSRGKEWAAGTSLLGKGLLPVEVVEQFSSVACTNHDFGQVNVGATSKELVSFDVYVHDPVPTLSLASTNLKLTSDSGTADFVQVPRTGTPPDCTATSYTNPTPSKTTPFCRLTAAFNPQSKGPKTATFQVSSPSGAPDEAHVQGTGLSPLSIEPEEVSFGSVLVGSSSTAPLTLTVCNHGPSPATSVSYQITYTNAADVVVVNDQLSGATLGPGATPCAYLSLRLSIPASAAAGPRNAVVLVSASYEGFIETADASLTGDAVVP
jgi:hypothetical protein